MTVSSFEDLKQEAALLFASGVRGRYAPSPTGPLHIGNIRTAMLAWLQVRLQNGSFILRIEDLDLPRTRPGSAGQIIDDLRWLGLDWDEEPCYQSDRNACYEIAFEFLRNNTHLFPCYCSRKDIIEASSAPHGDAGHTPIYPGTCRMNLDNAIIHKNPREPAWRYRVTNTRIKFSDEIVGPVSQILSDDVGDFVVRRSDKLFAYQLAVVIDDAMMGITDVVRGADLLESTPRQIALYTTFGFDQPRFWHVPVMCDNEGKRLSKRDDSTSIRSLRDQGHSAEELIGKLAGSVNLVPTGSQLSLQELLQELNIDAFKSNIRAVN